MSERYHEVRRERDHYREHCDELEAEKEQAMQVALSQAKKREALEAENKRLTAKLIDAEEAYSVIKDAYGELEGTLAAFACIAETSAVQLGLSEEWRIARRLVGL